MDGSIVAKIAEDSQAVVGSPSPSYVDPQGRWQTITLTERNQAPKKEAYLYRLPSAEDCSIQ